MTSTPIKVIITKIMCLPLMPHNLINEAYEEIKEDALEYLHQQKQYVKLVFQRFFTYFESYWLGRIGAVNLSIFDSFNKTNNHSEGFNKLLNKFMGNKHVNIWEFTGIVEMYKI